eukprot:7903180-Pyramimonas_sp.AAC.1
MRNVLESEDVVSMCWGVESTLAVIGTRGPIKWSNICEDVAAVRDALARLDECRQPDDDNLAPAPTR